MLLELNVEGFGIIESINWKPAAGLNVITGETGAGKSLVVDAVGALLSGQIKEEDIRHGAAAARVEGIFGVPAGKQATLRGLLEDRGLAADEDTVIFTCEFPRRGRAVPRINRQAVSRSLLREIGDFLVDIHAQSGHLALLDREQHLAFLDACARSGDLRREFGARFAGLARLEKEAAALQKSERDLARQTDLLNFQIEEIRRAELQAGEEEELKREINVMASAEKLKSAAWEIYACLNGGDGMDASSAADRLNEALPRLRQMSESDPSLGQKLDYLEGLQSGLTELARDIHAYGENLSFDPQRLDEAQNRLELIRTLKRKYGGSIEEILAYLEKAERELEGVTHAGERLEQLGGEIKSLREEMGAIAGRLSEAREKAAVTLAAEVKQELADLSMAQVEFAVSLEREESENGLPLPDGKLYAFGAEGVDDVEFMAATNPGEPLKPLSKIASTGEISRFMLALKVALAEADTTPVLIFDEIDIGVGGRSGEVIGKKLASLSRNHQVICVTHLPQIAAFGDAHYSVSKHTAGERTVSSVAVLEGEARLQELAAMLAGQSHAADSLHVARELERSAAAWKSALAKA